MAKDAKKFRCPNWSHEETMVLAELRKEAFLNKKEGRLVWERIAQTISSRFPNQKRSHDQCRRRWETLTKIYKHIEEYCMETGQDHWQLDEDELSSMKLDTAYRQDWYNIVKQVCSQRKRNEKSDCGLMAVKRGKRSDNCSSPSPVLPEPTPGSSLYVTAPASNCEPVITTLINGQIISTRPSLEAEKLSAEEEIQRLHTMLREKDALILELEQGRQHGQVAPKDQVRHYSPAEVRAHVKEPLQDAVLDYREVTVERSSKAAEQDGIGRELMVPPLSGSLSPEFCSDTLLLGAKNLAGYNDPFDYSTFSPTTLSFPTSDFLGSPYIWSSYMGRTCIYGTFIVHGSELCSYQIAKCAVTLPRLEVLKPSGSASQALLGGTWQLSLRKVEEGNQLCGVRISKATFLSRLRLLMQYRLICFHMLLFQSEFHDEISCLSSCRLELYRDKFYQKLLH